MSRMPDYIRVDFCDGNLNGVVRIEFDRYRQNNAGYKRHNWTFESRCRA